MRALRGAREGSSNGDTTGPMRHTPSSCQMEPPSPHERHDATHPQMVLASQKFFVSGCIVMHESTVSMPLAS